MYASIVDSFFLLVLRRFRKGSFFHCQMLNNILDCDDIGIMTSHSEINNLFNWVK
jgi:hypothetical protein